MNIRGVGVLGMDVDAGEDFGSQGKGVVVPNNIRILRDQNLTMRSEINENDVYMQRCRENFNADNF